MTGVVMGGICAAPLVPGLKLAFAAVCHQAPERCFHWFGMTLPVCARCFGLYAGALAGAIRPLRAPSRLLWLLVAANVVEFVSGNSSLGIRALLAALLCWLGCSRLISVARPPEGAAN
jgi:hypothetical protein